MLQKKMYAVYQTDVVHLIPYIVPFHVKIVTKYNDYLVYNACVLGT